MLPVCEASCFSCAGPGASSCLTCPADVSATGLIAAYSFNGNFNDESGNGNDATNPRATLTSDRFGNARSAVLFSGDDQYLIVPNGAIHAAEVADAYVFLFGFL